MSAVLARVHSQRELTPALGTACRTASKRPRTAGARGGGGLGGGVASSTITAPKPVTYADLGGIEPVLDAIKELIEYPLKHPEVGRQNQCSGMRGGVFAVLYPQ